MKKAERLVPPGFDVKLELKYCVAALAAASAVLLLGYLILYSDGRNGMYEWVRGVQREREGAVFPDCKSMLMPGLVAFIIASAVFLALAWRYVSYHFKGGSRCIYTMRRLHSRGELYVRCGALPVLGLLACQIIWRLLSFGCGLAYMYFTPERWLAPGAWDAIVRFVMYWGG